jgi:long-chain acyl-CoA synthetase
MNLAEMIEGHVDERLALITRNREITYGELRDQVARLRGGLQGLGVSPGDRVAILCANNDLFVVSYLAVVGMGAVAVPLNPASPAPEIVHELEVVHPCAAIVGPSAKAWSDVDRSLVPHAIMAERSVDDGTVTFAELLESEPAPVVEVEPDHLAAFIFTSGTAGDSKAAMLSHGNLLANIDQGASAPDRTRAGDVVFGVLPLFHIFGLNVVLGVSLSVGATIVLVHRFDPISAAESIVERKVTIVPGAPPLWIAFSHFGELPANTFESVRLAYSGASRLPTSAVDAMRDRFGLQIFEGYGLTEASPVVTSSVGSGYRAGSVGKVLEGQDVRLVGDDGLDVPSGDAGEVWVRGANVFQGYFEDPEATDRVLVDGWLRTGDIGTVDDDGFLYLLDRAKDLIIVSGFNVFPGEVEGVLAEHPAVSEVGVLGVPHPHHGEAVKAYVVLADGAAVDEETLIEHCLDYLARYKCPTKVVFVDELPRNASGKLVRRELDGTVLAEPADAG